MTSSLTVALLSLSLAQAPAAGWHADYPAALAEAKKTGRPIMLVLRCQP